MTSDPKSAQTLPNQTGGGYTPAPVKKTRTVTGTNLQKVSDQPVTHESSLNNAEPINQHVELDRSSKPSIQLNLNTIDQATQNVIEQEQEVHSKLAEFSPLSSTPMMFQPRDDDFVPGDWQSTDHLIPDPLTPSTQAYPSSQMPDLYKGRRRSLLLLAFILGAFGWFIGMATQVGVTRLISDPYGETMKVVTGEQADSKALENLRVPGVQTTVVIDEGTAVANVLSISLLKKKVFLVQGVLLNESSRTIESALLKLTLREPVGASSSWVQRFEFTCCEQIDPAMLSDEQLQARLEESSTENQVTDVNISVQEGGDLRFSFIAPIMNKTIRIKKDELPQATVDVVFFE
jgi:hypothetical protein